MGRTALAIVQVSSKANGVYTQPASCDELWFVTQCLVPNTDSFATLALTMASLRFPRTLAPILITTPTPSILIVQQWMPLRSLWWQCSEMSRTLVTSNLPASGASLIIQFVVRWFAMRSLDIITNYSQGMLVCWSLRPCQLKAQLRFVFCLQLICWPRKVQRSTLTSVIRTPTIGVFCILYRYSMFSCDRIWLFIISVAIKKIK